MARCADTTTYGGSVFRCTLRAGHREPHIRVPGKAPSPLQRIRAALAPRR